MRYELAEVNRLGNRRSNQDRFVAVETDEGLLLVLGDGMGGLSHGEVAAQILVDLSSRMYREMHRPIADVPRFFREVLLRSHRAINDFALNKGLRDIPGTTAVLCLIQHGQAQWAHVGDSRLYIFEQGLPIYRTTDHSYVEKLVQSGEISRSETDRHPMRNRITECLGVRREEPMISLSKPVLLKPEDILLLCSDGLWAPLDDALMGSMLLAEQSLEQILYAMAEKAEKISYPQSDNVSALALRVCTNRAAGEDPDAELVSRRGLEGDQLRSAIAQIEQVMREYQNEINK